MSPNIKSNNTQPDATPPQKTEISMGLDNQPSKDKDKDNFDVGAAVTGMVDQARQVIHEAVKINPQPAQNVSDAEIANGMAGRSIDKGEDALNDNTQEKNDGPIAGIYNAAQEKIIEARGQIYEWTKSTEEKSQQTPECASNQQVEGSK